MIYIREKCCCFFQVAIKNFEGEVDVQKGLLRVRDKWTIDVLCFIFFILFHPNDMCIGVGLL